MLEDVELGYRLPQRRHPILLDRELQVKHLKAWTLRSMIRTRDSGAPPGARLILSTGMAPVALNLRTEQRWSVALTGVALVLAVLSPLAPFLLFPVGVLVAAIIALNAGFYRVLRGARPPVRRTGVALHLIHFTSCGLGAAWAVLVPRVEPRAARRLEGERRPGVPRGGAASATLEPSLAER